MNKTEARDLISKSFKGLTSSSKSYQEKVHLNLIKDHLKKKNFSHVASYVSLPYEVSTKKINKFLADSKTHLYLPKIDTNTNKLEFALCNENTQFKKNSLNILEPISEEIIQLEELNAVIVPLRAFNRNFQRLGFGGGFYDTTFSEVTQPEFIGLAYEFQFIKKLKLEDFDIKLDVVFTDKQLLQKSLVT
jgi:5-formyltetrahydrofolate cyclo-ligase